MMLPILDIWYSNGLPGLHEDTNGTGNVEDEKDGDMGLHDRIVIVMWDNYIPYHQALGADIDADSDTDNNNM
jgi:hypothetical protein